MTGGVISGLGKGVTTASIGLLLKASGYKVSILKADMYLNLDAGTINPTEHGEVFVTEDGMESDQDLGNYERFLNQDVHKYNYMTMGQVYYTVITNERQLGYGGQDVEGHVHIPEEIIRRIKDTADKDKADIMLVEVGGTVGEYQNVMFFEAIRRMKQKSPKDVFLAHLVYLPKPAFLGEIKSKPAQASIYELYKLGIHPDFVICRSDDYIDDKKRKLIGWTVGIDESAIISAPDVDTIYKIPVLLHDQGLDRKLLSKMKLGPRQEGLFDVDTNRVTLDEWKEFVETTKAKRPVKIALVGKYFNFGNSVLEDAYLCVIEAIKHASWKLGYTPKIQWFDVERFEHEDEIHKIEKELLDFDGIIVPQGWGSRGVEGKIKCVKFARENNIPYLGLCFGMQMAVIEYSRNVLGLKEANSAEVNPDTPDPVIHIMPKQKEYLAKKEYGGTIRLGSWPCKLKKGSILAELYNRFGDSMVKDGIVNERHRHRYEVNDKYKKSLQDKGLVINGTSPDGKLTESIELPKSEHPFFVATQFHPEYISRPLRPHPIFLGFVEASARKK